MRQPEPFYIKTAPSSILIAQAHGEQVGRPVRGLTKVTKLDSHDLCGYSGCMCGWLDQDGIIDYLHGDTRI